MTTSATPGELTWIRMELHHDTGKTKVWNVVAKESKHWLGQIRWFGRWRKYAFFPNNDTVFESTCLTEIAGFCKEQMELRRRTTRKGGQ